MMQYGGCVLACLPHSNLMMCSAGGLRRFNGCAKDKIAVLVHVHMSAEPHSTLQQINNIVAFTQLAVHSD